MAKKKKEPTKIQYSTHPEYTIRATDWERFRLTMEGGEAYKDRFLKQKPGEYNEVYQERKRCATVPAFAASAVKKVRNAIYQRLDGVRRSGGSTQYQEVIDGKHGGIDMRGSTMEFFMGHEVLPELLSMGKVGIFVDSPDEDNINTLRDQGNKHPYMYTYRAEDIRNWEFFYKDEQLQFKNLLLRIRKETYDDTFGLVEDTSEQYRLFQVDMDGAVWVQYFNYEGKPIAKDGEILPHMMPEVMEVDRIPFVLLELEQSLLQNIVGHQIALMNMESLDINFTVRANNVLYLEQYDPAFEMTWNQGPLNQDLSDQEDSEGNPESGNPDEVKLGGNDARRYPTGTNEPTFAAPPSDPMRASMEKQQQLKDDIDRLLDLATVSSRSRYASAESKGFDERGLDSGLAAIGLVMEHAERQVGAIYTQYDGGPAINVKYPERYSLRSDEDRRKDAKALAELEDAVNSATWRKSIRNEIAETMLGAKISDDDVEAIIREVAEAQDTPTCNIEKLRADIELGLVTRETASLSRGWPKGEAKKAEEERAKRDAAKAEAQGVNLAARGLKDDPEAARAEKEESQNPDNNPDGVKKVRGEGQPKPGTNDT